MSTIIAVASGKGGVGKTLVTANLAIALQRRGYSVLAVDADMGLRNLDLMFGVQDEVLYDAVDVLKQRCRPDEAIITISSGLDFLAASQKHTWEKVDASSFQYVVEELAVNYDYVLIDCPPGRGQAYKNSVSIVDRILFVVEPTWTSMRDTSRVMQFCNKHKRFNYSILLNNFYADSDEAISVEEMLQLLDPESLAGVLPHSDSIDRAGQKGILTDIAQEDSFFQAMGHTVDYLLDGSETPLAVLKQYLPTAPQIHIITDFSAVSSPKETEEVDHEEVDVQEMVPVLNTHRGLSLRQRRNESFAWRRYHR